MGDGVRRKGIQRNEMYMTFDAVSENEAFARIAVAAFVSPLNPTMEEISDIKTAVSEAVTNAIIHGYDEEFTQGSGAEGAAQVYMRCLIEEDVLHVEVKDTGKGIEDIEKAMEPLFTTKPELRMWRLQWSRFLQQNRTSIAPAWVFLLWRLSWMTWR